MAELQLTIQPSAMKEEFMKKGMVMNDKGKMLEPKKKVAKPGQEIATPDMEDIKQYLPYVKKFMELIEAKYDTESEDDSGEEEETL